MTRFPYKISRLGGLLWGPTMLIEPQITVLNVEYTTDICLMRLAYRRPFLSFSLFCSSFSTKTHAHYSRQIFNHLLRVDMIDLFLNIF